MSHKNALMHGRYTSTWLSRGPNIVVVGDQKSRLLQVLTTKVHAVVAPNCAEYPGSFATGNQLQMLLGILLLMVCGRVSMASEKSIPGPPHYRAFMIICRYISAIVQTLKWFATQETTCQHLTTDISIKIPELRSL